MTRSIILRENSQNISMHEHPLQILRPIFMSLVFWTIE